MVIFLEFPLAGCRNARARSRGVECRRVPVRIDQLPVDLLARALRSHLQLLSLRRPGNLVVMALPRQPLGLHLQVRVRPRVARHLRRVVVCSSCHWLRFVFKSTINWFVVFAVLLMLGRCIAVLTFFHIVIVILLIVFEPQTCRTANIFMSSFPSISRILSAIRSCLMLFFAEILRIAKRTWSIYFCLFQWLPFYAAILSLNACCRVRLSWDQISCGIVWLNNIGSWLILKQLFLSFSKDWCVFQRKQRLFNRRITWS